MSDPTDPAPPPPATSPPTDQDRAWADRASWPVIEAIKLPFKIVVQVLLGTLGGGPH